MRRMIAASLVLLAIGVLRPELLPAQYADTPEPGQITFEQFRMLTRGMTEGQVLSKLGTPITHTTLTCTAETTKGPDGSTTTLVCPVLWTYTMPEGWTADLTFIAGRLTEFNNSKRP